jgi:polygalacturonase
MVAGARGGLGRQLAVGLCVAFASLRPVKAHAGTPPCVAACDKNGSNSSEVQTACLQRALDDCHSAASPAVLQLLAGTYHTGSLVIPSHTTLRLEAGVTLLGSVAPEDYPLIGALPGYGVPRDCCCNDWLKYNCSGLGVGVAPTYTQRHRALLTTAPGAVAVTIEGAGADSVIDGNGWPWWYKFESEGLTAGRPHLVEPLFVTGFRIEGVWLKDSPFWTLHPYACEDVVIRGLKITADPVRGHNTDGIDPDSCSNVLVEDCYVRVGDDAVAIKSGIDFAGRAFDRPSQNMLFRNCTFESKHVSIGSEQSGGVRNVTIEDCTLGGLSDSSPAFAPGIHLKVSLFKFSCIGWRLLRTILAN